MTDYSGLNIDRAIYTVSLQREYHVGAAKSSSACRGGNLPAALQDIQDLNFLDPNSPLFHMNYALLSAGHFIGGSMPPGIAVTRDRARTVLYGDSGGYQIINGVLPWQGDVTRRSVLDWLETYCDVAMTLDVPAGAIGNPRSQFQSFSDCLSTSLDSLAFFQRHRTVGRTKFLNVLQGLDRSQADQWYGAVKQYRFEGWALAGKTRLNFAEVCRRLIIMRDEGRLGADEALIHLLGTCRLEAAVLLTAIQRELRQTVEPTITITYDASTPSLLMKSFLGYGAPLFTPEHFRLTSGKMPRTRDYVGSNRPFPFSSAIGRQLTLGDLCVNDNFGAQACWDSWSSFFMTNHNLDCLLGAIDTAHRVTGMRPSDAEGFAPGWLLRGLEGIHRVFTAENAMSAIARYRPELTRLVSAANENDEEERAA